MKINLAAMTALASSLLLTAAVVANATPTVNLKSSLGIDTGLVELVRSGGHGGGGGGGGGGMKSSGGGGAMMSHRGGSGPSGRMSSRSFSKGDFGRSGGNFKSGRGSGHAYAYKNWNGGKNWDHGKNWHGGSKHHHGKNIRRFYGPGIFVYGGGYYGCDWLWRQAQLTGSAYWWRRYQECL